MKFTFIEDKTREEVLVFSESENELVKRIRELVEGCESEILGYKNEEISVLNADSVELFTTRDSRLFAITADGEYLVRERLYTLEEKLPDSFIKINQSTLANRKKIKCFRASIGGALSVVFKCGEVDYVSRRHMKNVKKSFGLKTKVDKTPSRKEKI